MSCLEPGETRLGMEGRQARARGTALFADVRGFHNCRLRRPGGMTVVNSRT